MNVKSKYSTSDKGDSDISDIDDDWEDDDMIVTEWLSDDEVELQDSKNNSPKETLSKFTFPDSEYIKENTDLYLSLLEVKDLQFEGIPTAKQEELMKTLIIEQFNPGDIIFRQNELSFEMYFVVASEETAKVAEVEVIQSTDGSDKSLTRLLRGQLFGQKYFLTKITRERSASIRVPFECACKVSVAKLETKFFDAWEMFRQKLLVMTIPLVQMLPQSERDFILEHMQVKEFATGEYIVRDGEIGSEFFIIREGSANVVKELGVNPPVHIVTLREGHFFGEMSLVSDEPRVASVIALQPTICLSLTKSAFKAALSATMFCDVLQGVVEQRKKLRENRTMKRTSLSEGSSFYGHMSNSSTCDSSGSIDVHSQSANSFSSDMDPLEPCSPSTSPAVSFRSPRSKSSSVSTPVTSRENSRRGSGGTNSHSTSLTSNTLGEGNEGIVVTSHVTMKKLASGSKIINKYLIVKELGKGAFGEVFLVQDEESETKQKHAMKVISRPRNDEISDSIRREIALMKTLRHPNVVRLHEVIDDPSSKMIFIIQEYLEGGPLLPDSFSVTPFHNSLAKKYFRDIILGVLYLHSNGIIHRDIKPQNLLLSASGNVKIADFGASVVQTSFCHTGSAGTPAFMAPEMCVENPQIEFQYLPALDIFSMGATLYCMVVGRPPWTGSNIFDLAAKIKNIELTFPDENIDPHLKYLLRRLLDKDNKSRITIDEILEDDWVTDEGSDPLYDQSQMDDIEEDLSYFGESTTTCQSPEQISLEQIASELDFSNNQGNPITPENGNKKKLTIVSNFEGVEVEFKPLRSPTLNKPPASHLQMLASVAKTFSLKKINILVVEDGRSESSLRYQIIAAGGKCSLVDSLNSVVEAGQTNQYNSTEPFDIILFNLETDCRSIKQASNYLAAIRGLDFKGFLIAMVEEPLDDAERVLLVPPMDACIVKPINVNIISVLFSLHKDIDNLQSFIDAELAKGAKEIESAIIRVQPSIDAHTHDQSSSRHAHTHGHKHAHAHAHTHVPNALNKQNVPKKVLPTFSPHTSFVEQTDSFYERKKLLQMQLSNVRKEFRAFSDDDHDGDGTGGGSRNKTDALFSDFAPLEDWDGHHSHGHDTTGGGGDDDDGYDTSSSNNDLVIETSFS